MDLQKIMAKKTGLAHPRPSQVAKVIAMRRARVPAKTVPMANKRVKKILKVPQ